jgi:glucose/arabinose dehydrogenase
MFETALFIRPVQLSRRGRILCAGVIFSFLRRENSFAVYNFRTSPVKEEVLMRLILTVLLWLSAPALAQQSSDSPFRITQMASGFDEPWAIGFLPDNTLLVSERAGTLWFVTPGGARSRIQGVPAVAARGQGGLMDILVPRDFSTSREIFLTFSKSQGRGSGTGAGWMMCGCCLN